MTVAQTLGHGHVQITGHNTITDTYNHDKNLNQLEVQYYMHYKNKFVTVPYNNSPPNRILNKKLKF